MTELEERTVPGLHAALIDPILHLEGLHKDSKILDLGCGSGAFIKRLHDLGYRDIAGADRNEVASPSPASLPIHRLDLNFPGSAAIPGLFDLVTAIEVIEHLENMGNFIGFIAEKLAPEGYLLLTTPNIHSLSCRARFLFGGTLKGFDRKGDPSHLFPLCADTFERCLSRHGLQIISSWTYATRDRNLVLTPKLELLTRFLRLFLSDPFPGDSLCLLIRRRKANSAES